MAENSKILLVFMLQSYIITPKTIRLNATYYFIMKIPNKTELQYFAANHSSESDFKVFHLIVILKTSSSFTKIILNSHFHFQ